jgi:hypothetical protein
MAFAFVFEEWLATGKVKDYAELDSITGLDRSRITRIMNLRLLEPGEQEYAFGTVAHHYPGDLASQRFISAKTTSGYSIGTTNGMHADASVNTDASRKALPRLNCLARTTKMARATTKTPER